MSALPLSGLVLLLLLTTTCGLLLDDACQAPARCQCSGPFILCSGLMLPRIPDFNITALYNTMYLYLQHNRILVVPAKSFSNLNANTIYLDLSSNFMRDLHPDAFHGIEDKITFLKLENNQIKNIPTALTNLTNLILLDIHDNPIMTFDPVVLSALGPHLQMLHMGSEDLTAWPQELSELHSLQALRLYHIGVKDLPDNAFEGFNDTLAVLEFNSTSLIKIPTAVCSLSKISRMIFVNNTNTITDQVMPNCTDPVNTLISLNLDLNNLQIFPDMFHLFPHLFRLSVAGNPNLTTLDSDIATNCGVSDLTLSFNNLKQVPEQIKNCSNLKLLDLKGNDIDYVDDASFDGIDELLFLDLSLNPLMYLSDGALANMSLLNHLTLDNTRLDNIPEAVRDLASIRVVDYRGNEVNCTCSELGWMNNMTNIDSVEVKGVCTNTLDLDTVDSYINLQLWQC